LKILKIQTVFVFVSAVERKKETATDMSTSGQKKKIGMKFLRLAPNDRLIRDIACCSQIDQ
jgi:hypothetical protein